MALTVSEVGEILRMIETSPFEEVIVELEGGRITARRAAATPPMQAAIAGGQGPAPGAAAPPRRSTVQLPRPAAATTAAFVPAASPAAQAPRRPAPQAAASVPQGLVAVRAPLVGTFFRRPAPDQPVLVEPGQTVKRGQPLCLIEVMKLYTMIESPADGVIEAVLADDGALVEYDQPLFAIRVEA